MSVTDTNAAGGKRPGRPRKDNKRPALSLRVNPELRQRLVAMAEENGRSITQQTELLDDPYVFNQVAAAAKHVLDAIGPAGDPAPAQLPRGIDPSMAAVIMMDWGRISVDEVIEQLTADDDGPLSPTWVSIRDLL